RKKQYFPGVLYVKMVFMETKTDAIAQIETLIAQLSARFTHEDGDEKEWLHQQCSSDAQQVLTQLSISALHILDEVPSDDAIGASINIVGLSEATGVPKVRCRKRCNTWSR